MRNIFLKTFPVLIKNGVKERLPRWPVVNHETDHAIAHFGFNDENGNESGCEVKGSSTTGTTPCMIKMDKTFKNSECSFWDGLNIYPDNS